MEFQKQQKRQQQQQHLPLQPELRNQNERFQPYQQVVQANHEQLSSKFGQGSISRLFGIASTLIDYEWLNVLVELEPRPNKKDLSRKSDYMLDVLDRI